MSEEQDGLDVLLEKTLPMGRDRLERDDEFLPFAAVLTPDGQINYVGPETEEQYPEPPDTLDYLLAGMRRLAEDGRMEAFAIVASVRLRIPGEDRESDAVQVDLEHRDGRSINVVLPYHKEEDTQEITYGELFEMNVEPKVFERRS